MVLGFILTALSAISGLHQRRHQKKQQARINEQLDAQKGFDVPVDGQPIHLPLVYGHQKVAGVKAVVHTSDSGFIEDLPTGFDDWYKNSSYGIKTGEKKEYMFVQQALCFSGIDGFTDLEVDGQNYDYEEFTHHLRMSKDGGVADPSAARFGVPDGDTNKFTNMAWASQIYKLNRDEPQYNGTPNLVAYVRGTKVRDIVESNGTYSFATEYTFSNNAALVLADYLTRSAEKGGCGLHDTKIDLAAFHRAKGICDTVVATDVEVRGRANGIRPVQDGEPEPLPTTRDVRLYECNVTLDTEKARRDNIQTLLETMAQAQLVYSSGIYKLKLEYPTSDAEQDNLVTATYTDNHILGKIEVAESGASERFSRCEVKFKNESLDFKSDSVSWPVIGSTVHNQFVDQDGGQRNETSYTLVGGTHRQSALAKAEELVRESRIGATIKFKIDRKALIHEIGDIIKLNSVAGKITNELFRITAIRIDNELSGTIQAERFDWNSLAWNVDDNYVEPSVTIPGVVVPNVSDLTWTDGSRIGDNKNNGYLTWTSPTTTNVRRHHISAKRPAVGEWMKISETVEDYFDIPADFNTEGFDYQFLVRTENSQGAISQGAVVLADQMPNLVPVSGVSTELGMNTVKLGWSNAVPQLVGQYKVYIGTSNVRANAQLFGTTTSNEMVVSPLTISNYYFWIDAIGADGSVAAGSATVVSALQLGIKSGDISEDTITWSHLADDVRSDMDGYLSNANAAAQAANTSAQAALIHANSANTSATTASNAASSADNSASAASTSASQASISASNSAQSAASSASSALTANTHAGTAKSYRDQAAVSKNDAEGSASSAASSAGVAATARDDAIAINRNANFQHGKEAWQEYGSASDWASVQVVEGVTGGNALKTSALQWITSHDTIPVDVNRTYKMTMRVKAEGGLSRVYGGAITYGADGTQLTGGAGSHRYFCANSRQIFAVDGWVTITGTITGEGDSHTDFRPGTSLIRPVVILQYTNSTATSCLIDEITFEDVTESIIAAGHASAASTSASSASASATDAGQSATAANSSKNSASTSASQAQTYRNAAATSATNAEDSAAAAAVTEGTVARLVGSGNFSNPVLKDWDGNLPAGFGATSINSGVRYFNHSKTNGKYHGYLEFVVTGTSGSVNRPYGRFHSNDPELEMPSGTDCEAVRVTLEVEKISGSWGGACARASWLRQGGSGNNRHVYYMFDDNLSDENGLIQTVEFDALKPAGFEPDGDGYVSLYLFGTSNYNSKPDQTVKWRLHRCSIQQLTAGASTYITQKSVADIEGNLSSTIGLRATSGSANASLELVSLSDPDGNDVSQFRIDADSILLNGSVKSTKMDINGALTINDSSGSFIFGKNGLTDMSPGIFMGRQTAQDGSLGFAFHAGREDNYIRVSKDNGLEIRNANYKIGSATATDWSTITSQTYNISSSAKKLDITLQGAGGGGGAGAQSHSPYAQPGQQTKVILRDGSTVKATYIANGGAAGASEAYSYAQPGQVSPYHPYGDGGAGGAGSNTTNEKGGGGGAAGQTKSWSDIDISNYSNPNLVITIGGGGAGGSSSRTISRGLVGAHGYVAVSTEGEGIVDAGVISRSPTASGSFLLYNGDNNTFRAPDLGPGYWWTSGDYTREVDGHSLKDGCRHFFASGRWGCSYNRGGGPFTIYYHFWPLG